MKFFHGSVFACTVCVLMIILNSVLQDASRGVKKVDTTTISAAAAATTIQQVPAATFFKQTSYQLLPINRTLNNNPMREISNHCDRKGAVSSSFHENLSGGNMHIVMIASPRYFVNGSGLGTGHYSFHKQTAEFYSKLHGYSFETVDPLPIMNAFGSIKYARHEDRIIGAKSRVMEYVLKKKFNEHQCKVKWVLFIDVDTVFTGLSTTLQSIVEGAEKTALHHYKHHSSQPNRKHSTATAAILDERAKPCDIIAQIGPNTINTGAMLLRVSSNSAKIIEQWIETQKRYSSTTKWTQDQGWFQNNYLQAIARERGFKVPPFDCLQNFYVTMNNRDVDEEILRNLCWAKNLGLMNIQPQTHFASGYCLLSGMDASTERLNLHDWPGRAVVSTTTGEYLHIPTIQDTTVEQEARQFWATETKAVEKTEWGRQQKAQEIISMPPLRSTKMLETIRQMIVIESRCALRGMLLYHGKDGNIVETLRKFWAQASVTALERHKSMKAERSSGGIHVKASRQTSDTKSNVDQIFGNSSSSSSSSSITTTLLPDFFLPCSVTKEQADIAAMFASVGNLQYWMPQAWIARQEKWQKELKLLN